jgi:predicted nucleic acid-binding protein
LRVLLDSTVLIDALRGRPVVERIDALERSGDRPCTTSINVEEIVRGMRPDEADAIGRLFAGLEILPIGAPEAWRAGLWRREFASRGVTLSQADCLIAGAAYLAGARIATGNSGDFPMSEVSVEDWSVGR